MPIGIKENKYLNPYEDPADCHKFTIAMLKKKIIDKYRKGKYFFLYKKIKIYTKIINTEGENHNIPNSCENKTILIVFKICIIESEMFVNEDM